jgi:hypothetical protein
MSLVLLYTPSIPTTPPSLFAETFEGTGYVAFNGSETIGVGSFLDEDYATSNVGFPTGWQSQCLRSISVVPNTQVYKQHNFGAALTGNLFFRDEIYVVSEGLGNNNLMTMFSAWSAGFVDVFRFGLIQDAGGVLRVSMVLWHDGASNAYTSGPITTGIRYVVELNWNNTADTWEWRVDNVTQNTGTLTLTHPTQVDNLLVGSGIFQVAGQALEILHDNVGAGDQGWLGLSTGDTSGSGFVSGGWCRKPRVFKPRARNTAWVEPGHIENDDPAIDTEEK